jgi:hypothetical protein
LGGGAAPAPPLAGSGQWAWALLRFFNSSGLVKRAVPRPPGTVPGGLAGMAELRVLVPGEAGRAKPLLLRASFLVFPTIAACKRRNARLKGKCAVPGISWRRALLRTIAP